MLFELWVQKAGALKKNPEVPTVVYTECNVRIMKSLVEFSIGDGESWVVEEVIMEEREKVHLSQPQASFNGIN